MSIKFIVILLHLQSYMNPGLTGKTLIPKLCEGDYSEGSVTKPCGLCKLCRHSWSKKEPSGVAKCDHFKSLPLFRIVVIVGRNQGFCVARETCGAQKISCGNKLECHNMFASYKCGCDDRSYGQLCEYAIPAGFSTDSFADVQNLFYMPYTYSTDFAVFHLYFYNTGLNFSVQVSTYREQLTYDADACKTNVMPVESLCNEYLKSAGVSSTDKVCTPHHTYETNIKNIVCAITVNLMFPRVQPKPDDQKDFFFEYRSSDKQEKIIVAKAETVEITVRNTIPSLGENSTVFSSQFELRVIYLAKSPLEKCSPLVKIPKISLDSSNASRFGRSDEISISSSVVSDNTSLCEQFGEPVITWFVWIVGRNHDERNDEPFKIIKHNTLDFPAFSLPYGLYKVRHEVLLQTKYFSKETAYCYFKIVRLPLSLVIVGGNLRYVYYKDNIELLVRHGADPNVPLSMQPVLEYSWTCSDPTDPLCREVETADARFIPGPFLSNKTYTFRLKVMEQHAHPIEADQLIIISPDPIPSLLIECVKNCGGKDFKSDPREIVYFLVRKSPYSHADEWRADASSYEWSCTAGERAVDIKVETLRQQESTPSWILIVEQNALVSDRRFVFKVRGGGKVPGEADYSIHMYDPAGGVDCDISPQSGVAGETRFTIECHLHQYDDNSSLTFVFYDKYNDEQNGRLVCSSFAGTVENLILTRGTVVVQVIDRYAKYTEAVVKVTLTQPATGKDYLKRFLQILDTLSLSGGYDKKISVISALCDILDNEPVKKTDATIKLLEIISKETPSNLINLELLLSTTQSVICNKGDCSMPLGDQYVYEYLLKILSFIANNLAKKLVRFSGTNFYLTYSKISFLYSLLMKCSGVLLASKDTALINVSISNIDYHVYKLYKYGNLKVLKRIGDLNRAVAINNLPYMKTAILNTDFLKTWLKEDTPSHFVRGSIGSSSESGVQFSPELAEYLRKLSSSVVVQTTVFTEDPYWWSQVDHVNTDLISVSVGYVDRSGVQASYHSYKQVTSLNSSIDVFVTKKPHIKNETVFGFTKFADQLKDDDARDNAITVHKIFPPVGASMFVRFLSLSEGISFRVLIKENLRPDYELMQSEGISITYKSPAYNLTNCCQDKENNDCTAYMGVLLGKNAGAETESNYTFELQTVRCQTWYDVLWTTSYCTVGAESSDKYLHCQCTHLSTIAGFFKVPINVVNPFTDYVLFLDIPNNPFIAALVLTVLCIYFIVLIWSVRKDKEDLIKTTLITLEDNVSSDTFGYIVIVCTGSRMCAGTSSSIGLTLHGSTAPSRSHILRSSQSDRYTLQRSSEDWFLVFTPYHLGKISSIQLWTSHSGPGPNWFCDRIYVRDLHAKENYTFVIGKWFGITLLGLRLESFYRPAKLDQDSYFGSYLMTNAINGFRDSHGYFSVVACHPRSPMSRPQRLTILIIRLLMTFLMSLMFFKAGTPPEDVPSYRVTIQHLFIAIYSLTGAITLTTTVFLAFRISQVINTSTKDTDDEEVLLEAVIVDNAQCLLEKLKLKKNSCLGFLMYYFNKGLLLMRKRNYYPVQANRENRFLTVHKKRRIFAWVYCCLLISFVSYIIILYGLKLGRVKSLLWLTSIGMSSGGHAFLIDPVKIFIISTIFGIFQTELCDKYAYDARELDTKKNTLRSLDQDCISLERRVKQKEYRPVVGIKMLQIKQHRTKIQKWWSFIDIIDVVFSTVIIFTIMSQFNVEYNNNQMFSKALFSEVASEERYRPSPMLSYEDTYWDYLEDSVIPKLFNTHWYNKLPMTEESEILPETDGWAVCSTHRLLGVPRLRQIRVRNEPCVLPKVFSNLSLFSCKVKYSGATEDKANHGTQWKGSEYDDVMFSQSPWIYHPPKWGTSLTVFAESGVEFHGGGYWGMLKTSQRYTADTISSLIDTSWLDRLTRVIFFEASTYNINARAFTVIVFVTEFMESSLVLSGKRVMSVFIRRETFLFEGAYFFCAVLTLVKLLLLLNNSGPRRFFTSFWCVYDIILTITGMFFLVAYRLYLKFVSHAIFKFVEHGGYGFFQSQQLASQMQHLGILLSLVLVSTSVRSLRILRYVNLEEWKKQTNTLYFTWPKIQWSTLVVVVLMFSLQRLVSYLVGTLYPLEISHFIPFRFSYLPLLHSAVPPVSRFFIFAPCFLSNVFMAVCILIVIKGFSIYNF